MLIKTNLNGGNEDGYSNMFIVIVIVGCICFIVACILYYLNSKNANMALSQNANMALSQNANMALSQNANMALSQNANMALSQNAALALSQNAALALSQNALALYQNVNNRGNTLYKDNPLLINQYLLSSNRKYKLLLQPDGDLQILNVTNNNTIWHTNTTNTNINGCRVTDIQKPFQLYLQNDNNLVFYATSNCGGTNSNVPWASGGANMIAWQNADGNRALATDNTLKVVLDDSGILYYQNNSLTLNVPITSK